MSTELRGYQSDCKRAVFDDFASGYNKLACVLPTGSGKTTIFGAICKDYTRAFPNERILIVSHLGLLVSQTGGRFRTEWGIPTGVLQGATYPKRDDKVIVTTMQSSREENKIANWARKVGSFSSDKDRLNVGLIIIDECHYAGAKSYDTIVEHFPEAKVLGFTATPFRKNKLMTDMFDKVSYTCSAQEMIDQGYLVRPELNLVDFDTTDQVDMFSKMLTIYKERHVGTKSVIFLKTIQEANDCAMVFKAAGIKASAITSEFIGEGRDQLLNEFRLGGGPDVLTTVDVLTAGFDSPNLRSIFIPYKVGSVTTYLQRVGRGLRPHGDKKHCDIYCGSISPGIEAGYWEKITEEMLKGGKRSVDDYDDLYEMIEYAKELMSKERYEWTVEVVNVAKAVKEKGLHNIHDMMVKQQFPEEMLDVFIKFPPMVTSKNSKVPATPKQVYVLNKAGLNPNVTKQEASAMIMAFKRASGWVPPKDEIVPAGKHQGKHWSEVPPVYIAWTMKNNFGSDVARAYREYKNKWSK